MASNSQPNQNRGSKVKIESEPGPALRALQDQVRRCRLCVEAGFIPDSHPIFAGRAQARLMLIGQAPGIVERSTGQPFSGRAGRELTRWMLRAGFASEAEFRERTYIASVTRNYPGRVASGGDRRPSAAEVELCRPWLEAELRLLRPRLLILVGQLAASRFLPAAPLEELVGNRHRVVLGDLTIDPVLVLPHPSGQSRWLNLPSHREVLAGALDALREEISG